MEKLQFILDIVTKPFKNKLKLAGKEFGKFRGKLGREAKKKVNVDINIGVFKSKLNKAKSAFKRFQASVKSGSSKIAGALKSPIAAALSLTAVIWKLNEAIKQGAQEAVQINKSFAAVNSLFDGTEALTAQMKELILQQSALYGTTTRANIKAYYDIVSSGIVDQTKALKVLDEANQLAIAGVTEASVAADALTSVMNAFGHTTHSVQEYSDILFTMVKKGKTTLPELAQSIGQVAPIAAKAGLSFQALGGAIATATAAGVKTPETMTQIKGILNSIIKKEGPQSASIIQKLGYEWNVSSLKAKGFRTMLSDLLRVTGGSADEIGSLIPNIRGLAGVFALAGEDGATFNKNLTAMEDSLGATATAVKKNIKEMNKQLAIAEEGSKKAWANVGRATIPAKIKMKELSVVFANVTLVVGKYARKAGSQLKKYLYDPLEMIGQGLGIFFGRIAAKRMGLTKEQIKELEANDLLGIQKENQIKLTDKALKLEKELTKQAEKKAEAEAEATKEKLKSSSIGDKTQGKSKTEFKLSATQANLFKKAGDALLKLEDKAIDKIRDGIKAITEQTKKAIQAIKAEFGGKSFSALAGARKSLEGDKKAQRAFKKFSKQVDIKELNAQGISNLAKASEMFVDLGEKGKSAVGKLLKDIENFKGEVTGEDVFGIVQSVKEGFGSDSVSNALTDLLKKSIEARVGDKEENQETQIQELRVAANKEFLKAQSEILTKTFELTTNFEKSVQDFKKHGEVFKQVADQMKRTANTPISILIKGDLNKILETSIEKSAQNGTQNSDAYGG